MLWKLTGLLWDSLSFLELVMSLERQFDFKMAPREVMNIDSLDAAIRIVEAQTGG